jgi:hypothetical protein
MASTTYYDGTYSARALGLRTDNAGGDVSPDLTGEEDRFESADIGPGYVSPTDAFEVTAATVWDVDVGSGTTDVDVYALSGEVGQGTYIVRLDQAGDVLTIAAADASDPRKDEIYLVVVDNDYDSGAKSLPRLSVRGGVAAASPSVPGPDAAWDAYELLATIDVPALAADILACTITDGRTASQLIVDAPTLEGNDSTDFSADGHLHAADYAPLAHVNTDDEHPNATASVPGFMSAADKGKLDGVEASADVNETNAELLVTLKTVDGAGSGLDADLLDNLHLASYGLSGHNHNSRYYTEAEQTAKMLAKADATERVRVTKNVVQSIGDVSVTDLFLQTELVDDWGGHSGSLAYILDDGPGYYFVLGQVQYQADAGGEIRHLELYHSGIGEIAFGRVGEVGGSDVVVVQVSTVAYFNGSEHVWMRAYHDAGAGGLNVDPTTTWLEMIKL